MLLEEFLEPMGITQRQLPEAIHVPYQRVNEIVNKKRGITPITALRLAKFFGVSEDFWLSVQLRCDLRRLWQQSLHTYQKVNRSQAVSRKKCQQNGPNQ